MEMFITCRLFYAMERMNVGPKTFSYNEEGLELAKEYYNTQQTFLQKNHQNDTFLSGNFYITYGLSGVSNSFKKYQTD